ncbi:hypothetical protein L210DRAFT_3644065 [Boletus edulis BED1]|uniref:Uncharacterized protein n=1 Tax=Boletus edulis BED1 TaxID=1328754 RepID=A0AAD4BYB3_BOLED|nr:hypothetical protein L210DRAFT_3644065 [Boletus edulis BED1]
MNLPDKTTILIVGAGPTGLAAVRSLLHHGFHDVDATPATLEALDTIGCGDEHNESLRSYTRHPYILIITQNLTECRLEKRLERLGAVVHRLLRVVPGLRRNASNPQLSDVTFEDGRVIMAT